MTVTLADRLDPSRPVAIDPGPGVRWLGTAAVGAVLAVLAAVVVPAPFPGQILAGGVLSLLVLPSLVRHYVPARAAVAAALLFTLAPAAIGVARLVPIAHPHESEIHDTTVLNDEAARMVARGENPYHGDYGRALPPVWHDLGYGPDGKLVRNPALDTYPYLPGSFLVDVPFVVVGDALGVGSDARILYLLAVVAVAVVIARRPEAPHVRAAAILGVVGLPLVYHLWWGTNDAVSLSLFVIGALIGARRPKLAGLALAMAISFKVVLVVPLLALAAYLLRTEGWGAWRRRWTCPAFLVATTLPYLAADPGAFVDQTLLFNLNRGSFRFPLLGMGLPAVAPDIFHGPVQAVTALVGLLAALVVPALVVWRRPTLPTTLLAGGLGMLGLFIPATNFRPPYLVLVFGLVACGWLGSASMAGLTEPVEASVGSGEAGSVDPPGRADGSAPACS